MRGRLFLLRGEEDKLPVLEEGLTLLGAVEQRQVEQKRSMQKRGSTYVEELLVGWKQVL